jgi:hypothetical protein
MGNCLKDNLTGLWTPYAEKLLIGNRQIKGEIYVDWDDMHSAYHKYGDENVATELRRASDFLKNIFSDHKDTHLTYISGDNIRICSTESDDIQLLNILHAYQEDFQSIADLTCGKGFPDPLTKEVFEYWRDNGEHRFQLEYPDCSQNVCTLDLRHLRGITEDNGMKAVENEILNFTNLLRYEFPSDKVTRTRCDEIWTFSYSSTSELERKMDRFASNYDGILEFDWGIGKTLPKAHEDLKKRKQESNVIRTKKGEYQLIQKL